MKVSSKEFYKALRATLGPLMKAAQFKPIKGGTLGWHRPAAEGVLSVWFQVDKWGWNERWGSQFTLDMTSGAGPGVQARPSRSERIGYLLEGFDDLDQLRRRNNAVVARLPGTLNGQLVLGKLGDGRDYVVEGYRVETEKLELGTDLWLNYYTLDDAREWARYFEANLLRFVDMYENETRSELGQGRVRFNRVMAAAQALPSDQHARKLALFEEMVRDEPVAYWKSAAAFWADEVRKKRAP